jgi:hypothetical protein
VVAKLIAPVLPLGLDTFAVAAAIGMIGVTSSTRTRVTALFTAFEAGMPLIGLALGAPLEGLQAVCDACHKHAARSGCIRRVTKWSSSGGAGNPAGSRGDEQPGRVSRQPPIPGRGRWSS